MSKVTNTNPPEEFRWKPGQSGNPKGKPKGAIHLSTRIQNMLNDDEFTTELVGKDGKKVVFKGNPAEAIIRTAILKAMSGDKTWADWVAKNGFGSWHIVDDGRGVPDVLEKYGLDKKAVEEFTKSKPTETTDDGEKKKDDRQTEGTS